MSASEKLSAMRPTRTVRERFPSGLTQAGLCIKGFLSSKANLMFVRIRNVKGFQG